MDNGNAHILPDSRLLQDVTKESQMVDWDLPSGKTVRIEVVPVFCANCGKKYGHVPKDNTAFSFYLCNKCFEDHGVVPGTFALPEDQFNQAVTYEMEERFGHVLDQQEILVALETNKLGSALEKLAKESPYPVPSTKGDL